MKCKNMNEVRNYFDDAYDENINCLSSGERAILQALMALPNEYGWKVYQAIPEYIDPLLERIIVKPSEKTSRIDWEWPDKELLG